MLGMDDVRLMRGFFECLLGLQCHEGLGDTDAVSVSIECVLDEKRPGVDERLRTCPCMRCTLGIDDVRLMRGLP